MIIRPGEVRFLEFPIIGEKTELFCRDQVKFEKAGKVGRAIIIESYFSDLKPFSCRVTDSGKVIQSIPFKVENREYKAEKLSRQRDDKRRTH